MQDTTARQAGPQHSSDFPTEKIPEELPLLLTPVEAARRLSLSRYTVYSELRSGRLRGRRYGRSWLVPREELERFAASLEEK